MFDLMTGYLKVNLLMAVSLFLFWLFIFRSNESLRSLNKKTILNFSRLALLLSLTAFYQAPAFRTAVSLPQVNFNNFRELHEDRTNPVVRLSETPFVKSFGRSPQSKPNGSTDYRYLVLGILLAGSLFFMIRFFRSYYMLGRILKTSVLYRKTGRCRIYFSSKLDVPISFYKFKFKAIVLPEELVANPKDLRIALAHESQHIRHFDVQWAYVIEILKALFWWNPAIFLWAKHIEDLTEWACDEQVLIRKKTNVNELEYAKCLLALAEAAVVGQLYGGLARGMAGTKLKTLSRRIEMVLEKKSKKTGILKVRGVSLMALLVFSIIAVQVRAEKETVKTNPELQQIVETSLETGLRKHRAKSGFAILADPQTGQILALSRQVFENGIYRSTSPAEFLKTPFEPNSLIKPFVIAAALEKKIVTESTILDAQGGQVLIGNRRFHDWKDHGRISVTDTIASSSFLGTIRVAQLMGDDEVVASIKRFGVGEIQSADNSILARTGQIQLKGGDEAIYNLPSIANGQGLLRLTVGDVLKAYSTFANGGKLLKLTEYEAGERPATMINQAISEETAQRMKLMLLQTMQIGTGKWAQSSKYTIMGKTATGDKRLSWRDPKDNKSTRAQFVGFAPYDKPCLISFVVVDDPEGPAHGSTHAATVVRSILNQALESKKIKSDRTTSEN
jgi:beta-lactamase regulating signal transducer with metallopeptidase domain